MIRSFKKAAAEVFPKVANLRKTFHQHPELAYNEYQTARLVTDVLGELDVSIDTGVAHTGVVAVLEGGQPGPAILLRADMDALPIQEQSNVDFASRKPGVMHACGHDIHTSSLLGTAMILHHLREDLPGSVMFVFQPSEERVPGGAKPMIDEGILNKLNNPVGAFAQHVFPTLPAGSIGIRSGKFMASADEIYLRIKGEGGHAAMPHERQGDPVVAAAHTIVTLQNVVSRHCPPGIPSVLSFGRVEANGSTNIIPDSVKVEGTFRAMDERWRAKAHTLIDKIARSTANAHGTQVEVKIAPGYPALNNDSEAASLTRNAALEYVGEDQTIDVDLWFASEDFAYFLQEIPGAFYLLGAGSPYALHTSRFIADESCLKTSSGYMAYLAWRKLSETAHAG